MPRTKLLPLLRCPEDHSELTPADDAIVKKLNNAIRSGSLLNRGGRVVDTAFEAGLVRQAGDVIYPILHGIPLLLRDEGIAMSQLSPEHMTNGSK